jgi:hypothetical protein
MNNLTLREEKRRLVRRILLMVRPVWRKTGYYRTDQERVLIWTPGKHNQAIAMPRNLVVQNILGVTQDGIAEDAEFGGLVTIYWPAIPVEDLIRIERFVRKRLDPQRRLF